MCTLRRLEHSTLRCGLTQIMQAGSHPHITFNFLNRKGMQLTMAIPPDDPLPRMRQLPRLRQIHGEEREWLLCPFTTMSVFRLSSNPWCLLLRQEWIGVNATNKADQSEDCAPWRRLAYCQEFRRPARMCDRSRRVYSADAGVRGCHIGEGAVLAG